jgi:hypothetical protein
MRLRQNIAAHLQKQRRQVPPRFSGACSFRDFCCSELREIDHLVTCDKTGPAMKYSA